MSSQDDAGLLRDYVEKGSERAFSELAERNVNLVYSAAFRQVRNRHAAEDLTQTVFLALAMKARRLRAGTVLSAWLLVATHFAAKDWLKRESRHRHERAAAEEKARQMEQDQTPARETEWIGSAQDVSSESPGELDAVLDGALCKLSVAAREALVLRFFEGRNFREVGERLGISEFAAKQRVFRAIRLLQRKMGTATAGISAESLSSTLMATAVSTAPSGLAKSAAAIASSGAAAAKHAALAKGVITLMSWTKTKIIVGCAVALLLAAATTGTIVHLRASNSGKVIVLVPATPTNPAPAHTFAPPVIPADVSAADLVRNIRASENWIDHVKSLSIRLESTWTKSPRAIELHKAELRKQFPIAELTTAKYPDLLPVQTDTVHMAFDGSRLRLRDEKVGNGVNVYTELHIWDGQREVDYAKRPSSDYEAFTFGDSPLTVLLMNMTWPRAAYHQYWWTTKDQQRHISSFAAPEEFEIIGREEYRGIDCWVLDDNDNYARLYVGVADHRLHGLQAGAVAGNPARDVIARAIGDEHHHPIASYDQLFSWIASLPKPEHEAIRKDYFMRLRRTDHPVIEDWMLDYKEISPGCLLPMTQGDIIYRNDFAEPIAEVHREMKIVEVKVDQDLPAEWFAVEMKEGVTVTDRTQDPPLIYKYKANMSPEEWAAIKKEAADRKLAELARQKAHAPK